MIAWYWVMAIIYAVGIVLALATVRPRLPETSWQVAFNVAIWPAIVVRVLWSMHCEDRPQVLTRDQRTLKAIADQRAKERRDVWITAATCLAVLSMIAYVLYAFVTGTMP